MLWRVVISRTARMFAIETGCPPPELLVTVSMISGIFARALGFDQIFQRRDVHIALEWNPRLRVGGRGKRKIDCSRAVEFDIRARRVEVRVAGNDVARLAPRRRTECAPPRGLDASGSRV